MRAKPYADCPEESTLQEVAAEMASAETSTRILQHASQCDHCGPLLSQYLEDFSDELSPEIEALMEQLPFSQPQWQRQKAREIAGMVRVPFWKRYWRSITQPISGWKPATASMVILVAGIGITRGPAIMNWARLRNENQSISLAFSQNRTIPGRLTGVDYGPYKPRTQKMGPGGADKVKWTGMNAAEGALPPKMFSGGKVDPRWWQIEGRILLLNGDLKMAEESFLKAQNLGVKDLSLEIDLAITYFEEENQRIKNARIQQEFKKTIDKPDSEKAIEPDFRNTINKLKSVLASTNPAPTAEEKKAAWYNLALAYETANDWGSAIPIWEDYLKANPTGAWAEDVQRHLDEDRKKAPRQNSVYQNPSEYNMHFREPEVNRNGEQYLQIGFERNWLPQAIEDPASEAGKAARNIAENFRQQHSDPMLVDLFNPEENGRLPPRPALKAVTRNGNDARKDAIACSLKDGESNRLAAMRALSAAFAFNKNSKQKEAIGCSQKAAELFAGSGNLAGELLAHFQEIYALQRRLDYVACMEQVDKLYPSAIATQYHWLQGQLSLEKAICATHGFKSKSAQDALEASRRQAKDHDFPELKLRVIGAEAGIDRLNHHYQKAWRTAIGGLEQYWKEQSSSERYYQFYAVMRSIAADSGYLYASEAYLRRSIEIFESAAPEDFKLKAVLHTSLANLLWELGEDAAAESEARQARGLIATAQADKTAGAAYFELPTIELANFELRRQQPGLALSTLKQIGDAPQTRDDIVKLDFYRVRGEAKLQLGRLDEAAEDYQNGLNATQEFFKHSTDEDTRLKWVLATNRIYAGFVQILLAKGQSEKALAVWEWSKSRLLDRGNRPLLDVEEAGSLQLPRPAYPHIVYASFEDRLQIWLVQNGRVEGKPVPLKQADLLRRIRDFDANCKNEDSLESEVERQEAELYKQLLHPVIAGLPPSGKVAIEFDDAVPSFAIEALKSPSGSYFGDDYDVLHSPGILAETFLNKPVPLKPQDKFLVADASPDNGPEVLSGHDLPARAIQQAYSNRVFLQGADLTPQKLGQNMQSSAALLVVSHGMQGYEGTGLKLSEDWSLQAKDFPQRLRQMRLAVLAACSSGYSENGLWGPDSLVRSLLASGVPNVIASRWDVDSQSTGELFENFYTYLGQGETPAQALRHARIALRTAAPDLLRGRSKRTHPYYWAGFYLTGKASSFQS